MFAAVFELATWFWSIVVDCASDCGFDLPGQRRAAVSISFELDIVTAIDDQLGVLANDVFLL
jgi:hypothetical protein